MVEGEILNHRERGGFAEDAEIGPAAGCRLFRRVAELPARRWTGGDARPPFGVTLGGLANGHRWSCPSGISAGLGMAATLASYGSHYRRNAGGGCG